MIGTGLERTYRKGRDAFAAAKRDRTTENLHEWRKQAKYFWHQLQLLEPLWPGLIGKVADQAHRLTDYLGEDHDLAVLCDTIRRNPEAFDKPSVTLGVSGVISSAHRLKPTAGAPPMLWKASLVALLATVAVLFALNMMALAWTDPDTGAQCVQESLRPGGSPDACAESAQALVNAPADEVKRWFLFDNFFVIIYIAMFVLIALAAGKTIFGSKPRSNTRLIVVSVAIGVAFAAGAADYVENFRSLDALRDRVEQGSVPPEQIREIATATMLKWMLLLSAAAISGLLALLALVSRAVRGQRNA